MNHAIGYLRVSTQEQGRSGLSLKAQRFDIENFAKREGWVVASWYQDIQTGAGKDALLLRPGLAAALKDAHALQCPLIVSRLDRLSRNVHFIAGMMEHKVHFIVAAFGRDVDHFTLHIYASIAQQERKMISERVKAAAAVAKRQGRKFGLQLRSKAWQRRVSALGRAALCREALNRAEASRLYIEWALKQPGPKGRQISFRAAAITLNDRNIQTPMGGRWRGHQLQRMAKRLKIHHPLARMPGSTARAAVQALWEQHPTITGAQLVANLGTPHPLDQRRAWGFLQECRRDAARKSPVHRKVGWYIDYRTTTRIGIGERLKRRPESTAQQVIESLGPNPPPFVRVKWVQQIMHECWQATTGARDKRPRVGRRALDLRRNRRGPGKQSTPLTARWVKPSKAADGCAMRTIQCSARSRTSAPR